MFRVQASWRVEVGATEISGVALNGDILGCGRSEFWGGRKKIQNLLETSG